MATTKPCHVIPTLPSIFGSFGPPSQSCGCAEGHAECPDGPTGVVDMSLTSADFSSSPQGGECTPVDFDDLGDDLGRLARAECAALGSSSACAGHASTRCRWSGGLCVHRAAEGATRTHLSPACELSAGPAACQSPCTWVNDVEYMLTDRSFKTGTQLKGQASRAEPLYLGFDLGVPRKISKLQLTLRRADQRLILPSIYCLEDLAP